MPKDGREYLNVLNEELDGHGRDMTAQELKEVLEIVGTEGLPIFPDKDIEGDVRLVVPNTIDMLGAPMIDGYLFTVWIDQLPKGYGLRDFVPAMKSSRNIQLIHFYGLDGHNEFTKCLGDCSSMGCPDCLKITRNPSDGNVCHYHSCPANSNYVGDEIAPPPSKI